MIKILLFKHHYYLFHLQYVNIQPFIKSIFRLSFQNQDDDDFLVFLDQIYKTFIKNIQMTR